MPDTRYPPKPVSRPGDPDTLRILTMQKFLSLQQSSGSTNWAASGHHWPAHRIWYAYMAPAPAPASALRTRWPSA